MDIGVYYLSNIKTLKKGDIVLLKTPSNAKILYDRKYLEKRVKYLIKNVAGESGDLIKIKNSKLYLNEIFLGNIAKKDKLGRSLKSDLKNKIIPQNKILLLGNTDDSYDSRYFGLIDKSRLLKKAKLIYEF